MIKKTSNKIIDENEKEIADFFFIQLTRSFYRKIKLQKIRFYKFEE